MSKIHFGLTEVMWSIFCSFQHNISKIIFNINHSCSTSVNLYKCHLLSARKSLLLLEVKSFFRPTKADNCLWDIFYLEKKVKGNFYYWCFREVCNGSSLNEIGIQFLVVVFEIFIADKATTFSTQSELKASTGDILT